MKPHLIHHPHTPPSLMRAAACPMQSSPKIALKKKKVTSNFFFQSPWESSLSIWKCRINFANSLLWVSPPWQVHSGSQEVPCTQEVAILCHFVPFLLFLFVPSEAILISMIMLDLLPTMSITKISWLSCLEERSSAQEQAGGLNEQDLKLIAGILGGRAGWDEKGLGERPKSPKIGQQALAPQQPHRDATHSPSFWVRCFCVLPRCAGHIGAAFMPLLPFSFTEIQRSLLGAPTQEEDTGEEELRGESSGGIKLSK